MRGLGSSLVVSCCASLGSGSVPNSAPKWISPCEDAGAAAQLDFCDARRGARDRAALLVRHLSLEEKAGLLSNDAKAAKSVRIGAYEVWNEALHGVAYSPGVNFDLDPSLKSATSFPQVSHTGMSFNKTLFGLVGSAVSTEARAFANAGAAGLTYWTPNINIFRDPRWGRGHEVPGEDPRLNGDYAEHFVRGFQEGGEDGAHLKASACCKHFAAYNLENWHGVNRFHFDAQVTARDMAESFLPAFEQCVRKGRVSAIMCSYNAINGVPSCANKALMTDLARAQWGFEGYVTTDCGAGDQVFSSYHFRNHSREQVVADMISAGVDSSCDHSLPDATVAAVRGGAASAALVDGALVNLFAVFFRLGMFDRADQVPFRRIGPDSVNTPAHQQLALEAARQGLVLLRNRAAALPLVLKGGEIALVGPFARAGADVLLGNYRGNPPFLVTLQEGLERRYAGGHVQYAEGCGMEPDAQHDDRWLAEAEGAAARAAQTVLAVGNSDAQAGEGHDRELLVLPGRQGELVRRVAAAAKAAGKPPVVVVLMGGGCLDVPEAFGADAHVGAVLFSGFAGMFAGRAIAEALFGDFSPSGRLAQTFYPGDYVNQVNLTDMRMHPDPATGYPGRGDRFYTGPKLFPFGFGLGYAKFEHLVSRAADTEPVVSRERAEWQMGHRVAADDDDVVARFNVTVANRGERAGAHVLLAFARPPRAAVRAGLHGDLRRRLVDYVRTEELAPGASQHFELRVRAKDTMVFASDEASTATAIASAGAGLRGGEPGSDDEWRWTLELYDGSAAEEEVRESSSELIYI